MGLLNPVIAAIFAAIFLVLWRRQPDQVSALAFGVSHILIGVGFLTFHLTPDPDAAEWSLLMHAIYSASTGLVVWGAAKRVGHSVSVAALVAIALVAAGLMYFGSFGTDMNARLMAANSCYGLMFALGAQVVGRAEKAGAVEHIIFWLLAITAAQFFIRPQIAIIMNGPMTAEAYRASEHYAVLMLFMGVDSLLLALTLVAAALMDQWRRASEEAEIDPLSGLKIRRSFESAAIQTLAANAERRVPLSLIVADLDHF